MGTRLVIELWEGRAVRDRIKHMTLATLVPEMSNISLPDGSYELDSLTEDLSPQGFM